jgi:hypothetical protein
MRSNKNKKNNPRKWRGYTALIKYCQHSSLPIVALLFAKYAPIPKKILELQKRAFNGEIGRPPHSLVSRFLALQIMRVKGKKSEASLVDDLTLSEKGRRYLGFSIPKKRCKKTPHNKIFTEYRHIVGFENTKCVLHEMVERAHDLGLYDEEFFVLDSKSIDLCILLECKHLKTCPWIKEGGCFPKDCLQYRYEGAEPGCKRGKNGKLYRYVGFKKHDLFDLKSGLRAWVIPSSAAISDSSAGKDLLRIAKGIGFKPKYTLADPAYDVVDIYKLIREMGSKPIIKMNERNTIAETFNEKGVKVNREGTPICKANHEMRLKSIEDDYTIWECSGEMEDSHCEDNRCLYNPNHDCITLLSVGKDSRRISIPPRSSEEWKSLYKKRKIGEGFFFNYQGFLGLKEINYTSFEDYAIYILMAEIAVLTMAIIAAKIGIPSMVREWKVVGYYILNALFGSKVRVEEGLIWMKIVESFGVPMEDMLMHFKKRKK